MRIAAVNFNAVFADIRSNLKKVAGITRQAASEKVELILFPELFTSSMGYCESMLDVATNSNLVQGFLEDLSKEYQVIIGGSYLFFDGKEAYNVFQLVFPSGEVFAHKKDLPTIGENCYFTEGDQEHVLKTPIGDIGVALCWEMVRYDTIKRLSQKVDLVLAGTCWADLPDWDGGAELKQYNRDFARRTPVRFAEVLRTPVVHSNHCGKITAFDYPDTSKVHTLQMIGATQIIDRDGAILEERSFDRGEGFIISEICLTNRNRRPAAVQDKYWIEDLPDSYIYAWEHHNASGKKYYEKVAKPYYLNNYVV